MFEFPITTFFAEATSPIFIPPVLAPHASANPPVPVVISMPPLEAVAEIVIACELAAADVNEILSDVVPAIPAGLMIHVLLPIIDPPSLGAILGAVAEVTYSYVLLVRLILQTYSVMLTQMCMINNVRESRKKYLL